jgi:squalene-hopene/tetraprenyl-beta-curcumene cyclase
MQKLLGNFVTLAVLGATVAAFGSVSTEAAAQALDRSLRGKAQDSVNEGLHYLRSTQRADGSWSGSVGITALAVRAFLESYRGYDESDGAFITKPINYLLSHARSDGSISESNRNTAYNTATAMFALAATKNPKYQDVIARAQSYLRGHQIDEGEGYDRTHRYYGGIGYGGDERPDLSNQYLALEGLRASALDPKDPVWERAILFVSRCQNRSESNDQAWATNDGGFTYMPGFSPHGGTGSYGGMTHAGLISLLFAGVDKQDPRVQAAWKWIAANYDVEEVPGVSGRHGLFYYYEVFAKTMFAMGEPTIKDGTGKDRNWRDDIAAKLIGLQAQDGSWVNPYSNQWWEDIKDLITARGVIALNLAMRR